MPAFFVPKVEAGEQEEAYREYAKRAGGNAGDPARAIYSITWRHDGVVWTATVGETLTGVETVELGKGRNKTYRDVPRRTDDTVLAIYDGDPCVIVHDSKSRIWNWPIYAGRPSRVVHFDA